MKHITEKQKTNFKSFLLQEEKSALTMQKYMRDVNAFEKWLSSRELTKEEVLHYKEEIVEKYAPASVNSMLSSLNCFFEFLNLGYLKVKTLKIQRCVFMPKEKELTKEEYQRLLKAALKSKNYRLHLIIETICSLGIRVSELKFITVNAVKEEIARINCKGKIRVIMLTRDLCKKLKEYIKTHKIHDGSVFVTKNRTPVDRTNIWREMKALCAQARVDKSKVFPHNLRHLFARTFYSIEKDIVKLADILGHANINTTRIYTCESAQLHKNRIQNLGLFYIQDKKTT